MRHNLLEANDDGLIMRPSGQWAEEKLDYLSRYIYVFETSMRKKFASRNYIDLFAGPGKNQIRETSKVILGSPLLALSTKYPFSGYYFVEQNENNLQALVNRCNVTPLSRNIKFFQEDCNNAIKKIITEIGQDYPFSLNLAFLDPEGLELKWDTIVALGSIKRMDLIVNYPQNAISRNIGICFEKPPPTIMDEFFGNSDWRSVYEPFHAEPEKPGLHRALMDYFKAQLVKLDYVQTIRDDETGDEPLIRNSKRNAPMYRLLFASKHELGNEFWQKITRRNIYGQRSLW